LRRGIEQDLFPEEKEDLEITADFTDGRENPPNFMRRE
jgi:hypothetical protein